MRVGQRPAELESFYRDRDTTKEILVMRLAAFCLGIVLVPGFLGNPRLNAVSQEQDDDVRGAFMTTRPKTTDKTKAPATRRPRRRPTATAAKEPTPTASPENPSAKTTGEAPSRKSAALRIGIGLTLFMRDSNGLAVRVDPNHEFHKGDDVRVLLETNADGHLYIFNTTDGGAPVMIYPDAQLDDGGNFLEAHVPFELPSSVAAEERLRWFSFDEHAGAERLYFVFTREPLPSVPIEDDLIKYCEKKACAWHPSSELWSRLQNAMGTPLKVDNAQQFGKVQTGAERDAATRGIGLAADDPQPVLVMMNASSSSGLLVTFLQMVHQ
jgi:hypothetical protein